MEYVTKQQLAAITGKTFKDVFIQSLNFTLEKYEINTKERICHFLAQVLHESGAFRYKQEIWGPTRQQKRYDPPTTLAKTLGNKEVGDGFKYRGRGYIQLTGKSNYEQYSGFTKDIDFVKNPDKVAQLPYSIDVAGWFWHTREINDLVEIDESEAAKLKRITKKVNGGTTGLMDRTKWYYKCKAVIKQPYNPPKVEPIIVDGNKVATMITIDPSDTLDMTVNVNNDEQPKSSFIGRILRKLTQIFKRSK